MLRACVLTYNQKWDECLPLAEFAYTTVIKKASKWLLLKHYMGGGVEPH